MNGNRTVIALRLRLRAAFACCAPLAFSMGSQTSRFIYNIALAFAAE
jgi:hypothetical protein